MNKKMFTDMLMLTLLFISVFIIIFVIYWLIWRGNQRNINQLTRPIQEEYRGQQDRELVLSHNRYQLLKRNREFIVQPQREVAVDNNTLYNIVNAIKESKRNTKNSYFVTGR